MERILIRGGAHTSGTVCISGAKNSALPIIVASLLTEEKVVLHNVPLLKDVAAMIQLTESIGAKASFENNDLSIEADAIDVKHLLYNDLASQIRYSTHLVGALSPQFRKITLPLPGGCKIGNRNLNSHILGLSMLGAKIAVKNGNIEVNAGELKGCHIVLEFPSVGATENIMMAACLSKGTSVLENVAKEPEIVDLANFLNTMGADITGAGTNIIKINGVKELTGTEYTIMPDRIETGTYMTAALITRGEILLRNTDIHILESVVSILRKIGATVRETKEEIKVTARAYLNPANVVTEVYPGFPTDMQPIITSLLTVANGKSTINETIYENRFTHVPELIKMGANIRVSHNILNIDGVKTLRGAKVYANDIRAGASLILASLAVEGDTVIENAYQIFRGYEKPLEKLAAIGVDCKLIENSN